jgi:hypothetical protein
LVHLKNFKNEYIKIKKYLIFKKKIILYNINKIMASYSNSSYTNDFFDLNSIFFNSSVEITTGLAP